MTGHPSAGASARHVVVVGMHRSGTSAVANALARLGLELPDESDLITPGPFNERGYWESRRFVTLNDKVLAHFGGTWSAPPVPAKGWQLRDDPAVSALRSEATAFSAREFCAPHMVLKDPRLCITLPLWRTVFAREPVAVAVVRDPIEVARSLEHRNGFPLTLSLAIWRRYVQQSLSSVEGLPLYLADYDRLLRDPREWLAELVPFLVDHGVDLAVERAQDAARVLEPGLRHHRTEYGAGDDPSSVWTEQREFLEKVYARLGRHARWSAPALPAEPAWVGEVLEMRAAGEMIAFAEEAARRELKWIKRSRLFRAARTVWQVTGGGPVLTPDGAASADGTARSAPRAAVRAAPRSDPVVSWARRARGNLASQGRSLSGRNLAGIPHEDNPADPDLLDDFLLYAVVKSWMDADVIEATVKNALAQGVDAVFLVDNASTDATESNAVAAGAIVAEVYASECFDGRLVQQLVNAVVARESLRSGADHVWWLLLDSDEFPEGPGGTSLRAYLAGLDGRFRIVGGSFMNHVPSGKPEYVEGFHPIDFQPLCYTFEPANHPPCALGHWKHLLQRFDRHGQFVVSNEGAHLAFASERLVEPTQGIVVHHFQYRDEARTRDKLELASARSGLHESAGYSGFARRRRSLDAVYSQRWDAMEVLPNRRAAASQAPRPWAGLAHVRRWYPLEAVRSASRATDAAEAASWTQ